MTLDFKKLLSNVDASVNFVAKTKDGGALEARFVQRDPSYFIVYLSSQTGCNQACRFCHLTQLRETKMGQATLAEYAQQFNTVMQHYDSLGRPANRVNVNLMARGEPLLNPNFIHDFNKFEAPIKSAAKARNIAYRINISSIFPIAARNVDLVSSFQDKPVNFYWSLYSMNPTFRKRWIPKADRPENTIVRLLDWQEKTGRDVTIHHSLIKNQNDRRRDHLALRDFIRLSGLKVKVNLVRYNSFGPKTGQEATAASYTEALEILSEDLPVSGSRIVPRVGPDVAASCGMFVV